ncbi:hypothetical protein [Encephalitozoon cuniculi GB-M1]|uniref:Uncharacterized protein n=2 Tax=Encephalitozoon cuniculi TaxID=6035 RepID=Q8SUT9_ENCCU|nr:uncharacterized protein ECU08_0130 [Encephalitozoon cuniculi GB-M1]AGE95137.1 hypothetical protein ECU08_0130 [Encephalitozoon cuniculi]KMV65540.1 hypothetical protein M970_080090 [Encephalitozoon cuniculi EcunIII-L]UYI26936.1 DNA polymerase sliding clamp [Encephalitozoon cuniculi]CAD26318.1 hypothetical protein [Encephalitozoon cuniculi GB-M1]
MGKVSLSPLLHDTLVFMKKFASKITVTRTSICSKSILVEMPEFCDCCFTVKTRDFAAMLKQTQEFTVEDKALKYRYEVGVGGDLIKVEKRMKKHDEVYQIAGGFPLLSIVVNGFKVLSSDDLLIRAGKDGSLTLESFGIVKTKSEYLGLRVPEHTVDLVAVKVKSRDLRILEDLRGDLIFSFLDSHILVYSLGNNSTTVVQIGILST